MSCVQAGRAQNNQTSILFQTDPTCAKRLPPACLADAFFTAYATLPPAAQPCLHAAAPYRLVEADAELHDLREALGTSEERARRLEAKLSSTSAAGDAAAARLQAGWDVSEAAHREALAALRGEVGGG